MPREAVRTVLPRHVRTVLQQHGRERHQEAVRRDDRGAGDLHREPHPVVEAGYVRVLVQLFRAEHRGEERFEVAVCGELPEPIEIPAFSAAKPTVPELEGIPSDTARAIKALTVDLSRLDGYTQQLEEYIAEQDDYYHTVIKNINL